MPANREHQVAHVVARPSRVAVTAIGFALLLGSGWGVGVGDASAVPPTVTSTAAGPAVPAAPRAADPTSVAPTVTETGVPGVVAAMSPSGVAKTLTGDRGTGQLVAHLRQPVGDASVIGVTWESGTAPNGLEVQVRTQRRGEWSGWAEVHADPDEGPSAGEDAVVRGGTEPLWIGRAETVEVAAYTADGSLPRELRLQEIDPGTSAYDATATGPEASTRTTATKARFPSIPSIVTRAQWGADESLGDKCFSPRVGEAFKMVFVHHTVGSNSYSRAESAAIVRGIYAYHTASRGWCDIGYNFLVDRYGTIYEGRDGGIRRPVRGAHAGDYNTDSTGISLMGNFETTSPTKAMKAGLVRLIAWRLGTAYRDAYGGAVLEGDLFRRISGHRDAMSTACPGQYVYDWLPRLRERVADRLGHYRSAIESEWLDRGGSNSTWGPVRMGEQHELGGAHTTFGGGRMYRFDAETRVFRRGPILNRYVKSGEVAGNLGYPLHGIRTPANGAATDLEHGSIFWSKRTGSHILKASAVTKRYRALGAALSDLGFPRTPVLTTKEGTRAAFQHGAISFDKSTGRVTVTYK